MKKSFTVLLLLSHMLKEVVWIGLIPLWHFPDEQSHVAQVAYIAEKGLDRPYGVPDLTEEIRKSEELLGTERDEMGINKFTYHPEYRIEYTDTMIGAYEEEIQDLAIDPKNREMVKQEASRYPPLYYTVLAGVYRLLYRQDIIIRVFTMRLVQMLLFVGAVYFSYRIGTLIFSDKRSGLLVGALASFHPMFSFVSAGVNSDSIGTFLFTVYIYLFIRLLYKQVSLLHWGLFVLLTLLTMLQKPQFILLAPLTMILILVGLWRAGHTIRQRLSAATIVVSVVALGIYFAFAIGFTSTPVISAFVQHADFVSIFSYATDYMVRHLYREVLPWYWGVYDWLGVTYPRVVHRMINWSGVVAGLGLLVGFLRGNRQLRVKMLILAFFSILLVIGIYGYDWLEWSQRNIHLGVQGRYFFPAISAHMSLLLFGVMNVFPRRFHFQTGVVLLIAMMALNGYAVYMLAATYYDVSSLESFIIQTSQYKPWFFKGGYLIFWLFLYLLSFILFLKKILLLRKIDS